MLTLRKAVDGYVQEVSPNFGPVKILVKLIGDSIIIASTDIKVLKVETLPSELQVVFSLQLTKMFEILVSRLRIKSKDEEKHVIHRSQNFNLRLVLFH